eukprot:gene4287-4066_t
MPEEAAGIFAAMPAWGVQRNVRTVAVHTYQDRQTDGGEPATPLRPACGREGVTKMLIAAEGTAA